MGYARKLSVRTGAEITRVIRNGKKHSGNFIQMFHLEVSGDEITRVGFVIPRYKQSVVKRNLVKRRLHEIARTIYRDNCGKLVIVRINPAAYNASYGELESEMKELHRKFAPAETESENG